MTKSAKAMLALLTFLGVADVGEARVPASKAEAIIAASKRATGGTAWDKPQGCFEEGTHADGAIVYRTRFSLLDYGMRIDSERGSNTRSMGFNGKARWQAAGSAKVDVRSDRIRPCVHRHQLSQHQRVLLPRSLPSHDEASSTAREADRRFDVIEITPEGGRSLEIWFDSRTHLIQRVVDDHGTPPVRVEAATTAALVGSQLPTSWTYSGRTAQWPIEAL